jgi:hypothetical protein
METKVAHEHIRDCADLMTDGIKTLRRISKSFPQHQPGIGELQGQMEVVRKNLDDFNKSNFPEER